MATRVPSGEGGVDRIDLDDEVDDDSDNNSDNDWPDDRPEDAT